MVMLSININNNYSISKLIMINRLLLILIFFILVTANETQVRGRNPKIGGIV